MRFILGHRSALFAFLLPAATFATTVDPLVLTLTASNYNGYNISCNGAQDGWIDLTITGGTAPYTITWSNKETTEDISGLAAGYYKVGVVDVNGERAEEEITLTQPLTFHAVLTKSSYPNGYNVSCFECSNGTITPVQEHGIAPFTYLWQDGPTTGARSNLGPGEYKLKVTDANGCRDEPVTTITQPDRSDWTMAGNAGTDPTTQYFGTSDNKDAVFRTNATERFRLKANGEVKVAGLTGAADDLVYVDGNGVLKRGPGGGSPAASVIPWYLGGNNGVATTLNRIGPLNNVDFILVSNATERMRVKNTGLIGMGTNAPETALHVHADAGAKLLVSATTGDAAAWARNNAGAYALGVDAAGKGRLLSDYGTPAATMTFDAGKVAVGSATPTDQLEVHTTLTRGGITLVNDGAGANAHTEVRFKKGGDQRWSLGCDFEADGGQDFFLWNQATESRSWRVDEEGRIGIGEVDFGNSDLYKLYVEGGIVARDVKVTAGTFPDYVFATDYPLRGLDELRRYLRIERHLPGMPTAAEVDRAQGVEVGDLAVRLLRTVEEQALYILQLEERLKAVESELHERNGR